ncbi:uncharacterized protein TOT_020000677 [Theileria orientalis strain Shintoku]|uniref:Actin n=1 Tax=Theileria orientalis strain Shintoku TaxID=869250 RepID=J4C3G9_THEOR|nr:uncharacterized protein TOT_020000677 [Theileria orientalis strain Shintoku]BAM40421.1 uncharacterized protein TOT_020000677 [Theileria orientalis strain Shintoku]|eukprot:XP_009690722.1 uncharacterized protein TOT_020000677 [Theileria orientalis strain Shintoku]
MPVVPIQSGGDDVSAIVVDPGFESIRIGNCQEDFPREYIPSAVYREFENPSSSKESWQILSRAKLREFAEVRRLLHINRESNLELDPFVFERLLCLGIEGHDLLVEMEDAKSVTKVGGLGLDPAQHPILVVEPTAESKQFRDSALEVVFEQLGTCAAYLAKRAALTAFSVGRSSALVVDVGAGGCTVSPVHEGISLQSTIQDALVGGNALDLQLADFLFKEGYSLFAPSDDPRVDYFRAQTAKELREKFCTVKVHPDEKGTSTKAKDSGAKASGHGHASVHPYDKGASQGLTNGKEPGHGHAAAQDSKATASPGDKASGQPSDKNGASSGTADGRAEPEVLLDPHKYYLPDGVVVDMRKYEHSLPELLFSPAGSTLSEFNNFKGIVNMINDCVFDSDVDIRKELLSSVVVAGGFTLTRGLIPRLSQEIHRSPIGLVAKFKLVHSTSYLEKRFSTWLGGSILASLGRFQQLWISKAEYMEHGTIIAYRRCH